MARPDMKKQLSNDIWIEKYRPDTVEDILLPKVYKKFFTKIVSDGEIPNMLLYSTSPGVGKCLTGDMEIEIEIDSCIYNKNKELFNN